MMTKLNYLLTTLFISICCSNADASKQPNFIIIMADDLGYGDIACYGGAEGYATPQLDKMAAEGMRFTDFHSAHMVCSASRTGLLTGRHPNRVGVTGVFFPRSRSGMPLEEITIAEMLKEKGYATAAIGKWHLGHLPKYLPTNQGFDMYYGIPYSNDMAQDGGAPLADDVQFFEGMTIENYREHSPKDGKKDRKNYTKYKDKVPLVRDTEVIEWPVDQRYITKRFAEKTIEFVDANKDKPFFVYLAHPMPHTPLFVSEKFEGKTERGLYGDVIEELDWSVGIILDALKERGLADNTMVVFTSDNGPWLIKGKDGGSSGDLRDGKGSSYEGGQRVPAIFWWPGKIPAGVTTNFNASSFDLLPTIADLSHAQAPQDRVLDGQDIASVLMGEGSENAEDVTYLYGRGEAIRIGDWKYRNGTLYGRMTPESKDKSLKNPKVEQLFNLEDDLIEQNNLMKEYPEKAQQMKQALADNWAAMKN